MRTIKTIIDTIAGWISAGWQLITITVRRGIESMHRAYVALSARHVRRWAGDSGYRRTLLAAVTALAATVLPHPALAAALGAAIAEWAPRRHDPYDDDSYDDEYGHDRFDPRRRLWDTYA